MFDYLPASAAVCLYVLAAVLGLVLGSALNCLSFRIARHEKWSGASRSCCPVCGHTLGAADLVPLLSWLFLRGKCRYCRTKISPRYPLTEALLALCFVSLLYRFGLGADTLSAAVLCCCLLCLSLVDLDTQLIPDRFLVIPAAVRAVQLLLEAGLPGLLRGVLPGLVVAGAVLLLALAMEKFLHKDAMGGGDIKLLALLGMFFGFPEMLLLLIFACVMGIFMAAILMKVDPETAFPFGPALSLAAWLTLIAGDSIVSWYLSLFA